MSGNRTNTTNTTGGFIYEREFQQWVQIYISMESVFAIVGTLLNLWFLVAIVTSREMRSRLRNKIICNTLVVHLLDSSLTIPAMVVIELTSYNDGCAVYSTTANLQLIQEFIVNWLVVMILVVFIAQIQDFNPRTRLTPMAATLGTVGLLVLPWVASLVVVPIIVHQYYIRRSWHTADCFYPPWDSYQVFKSIDTAVPILLAVLLLIAAAALRFRRFTRGYTSGSMRVELISRGPEIDNTFAYVAAVVLSTICDFLRLMMSLDSSAFYKYGYITWLNIYGSSLIMTDSRVVLTPLVWLLLPDVRQRIKTWRPWYRPAPGIDLTVNYRKEEN